MSRTRFAWHIFKPLIGLNFRHAFPESYLYPNNLIRLFRSGKFLFVLPLQLALLAVVTGLGTHYWTALIPPVSAATFGLFLSQVRGIAEHGVRDPDKQIGFVQSHAPNLLDRLFLYDLNFNLHEEHHRDPQIPSCHLPAVHASMTQTAGKGTMWHTVKTLSG